MFDKMLASMLGPKAAEALKNLGKFAATEAVEAKKMAQQALDQGKQNGDEIIRLLTDQLEEQKQTTKALWALVKAKQKGGEASGTNS